MAAHQGQTDSTLQITLTPFLLRVGFTMDRVAQGGRIGVEAITLNVADGAQVEISLLDGDGGKVGKVSGEIQSGIFRGLYLVDQPNSTGRMIALAELPDYGLQLAGPACRVLPPVRIENLRWMDAEGTKEIDAVVRGQKVALVADVALGPMEEEIAFEIVARPEGAGKPQASGTGKQGHSHEAPPQRFQYPGRIRSKKIQETFVADWEVQSRKARLEFTINLLGVVSAPSKKVGYAMRHGFSG